MQGPTQRFGRCCRGGDKNPNSVAPYKRVHTGASLRDPNITRQSTVMAGNAPLGGYWLQVGVCVVICALTGVDEKQYKRRTSARFDTWSQKILSNLSVLLFNIARTRRGLVVASLSRIPFENTLFVFALLDLKLAWLDQEP